MTSTQDRVLASDPRPRPEETALSIADILEPLNDSLAARAESFRAIGEPGLYETNESTPERFYEDLRRSCRLDGYVYGPGCGNVLSMVECFESTPRGLILVDVDPAVVLASRILVNLLKRHAEAEGLVAELFCSGRPGARRLIDRALEAERSASLRRCMEQNQERFLQGLRPLTSDFTLTPADIPAQLERWASYHPSRGKPVPVRSYLVRNYDRLRSLALADGIAVLLGSLLDPDILQAVSKLPELGTRRSLIYVSNIADHFRRRALRQEALRYLKLAPESEPGSLFAHLNEEQFGRLRIVTRAAAGVTVVRSVGIESLTLKAASELPLYTEADFGPSLDLRRVVPAFLTRIARSSDPEGGSWRSARKHRATTLRLYAAGITADQATARHWLEELTRDAAMLAESAPSAGVPYEGFWLAEAGLPLVLLRRSDPAIETPELWRCIETLAERTREGAERLSESAPTFMCAQALAASGVLLSREDLQREGSALAARIHGDLSPLPMSVQAEVVLRAAWTAAITRRIEPLSEAGPLVRNLLRAIASGALEEPPTSVLSDDEGYQAHLCHPDVQSQNLRLGLLFFGLLSEDVGALEAALLLDHRLRNPDLAATVEPDGILADLARESLATTAAESAPRSKDVEP